ncbi:MAG TPA: MBL fold metallo-hydrolase [Steroidobacteraceae bacterium]|nr:MBL fold metallo-hydrolase [Steroidobacteraceae bacterium]
MNLSYTPQVIRHPHGIFAVDAEYLYPGHAAVHIIRERGRAAFVDTGTSHSVPYLLAALDALNISRDAVDYVFLTHVHLDHAGGAGRLMRELPNARAVVHPRGEPHMIDPAKVIAGSAAVYGEERFRQLYGDILPIEPERLITAPDGYRCELAGRKFELLHTPGHALHHYAIVDRAHSLIFAGDTFGISYRALDTQQGAFILPTTSPSQFDPQQLTASVDRLLELAPESIYLMHYSRVTGIPRLGAMLKEQIQELVRITRELAGSQDPHAAIREAMLELWWTLLQRQGSRLSRSEVAHQLESDLELNTQGLLIWLHRAERSRPAG